MLFAEISLVMIREMLCLTYGTWEVPGWPASATMRCWAGNQGLEESAALAAGEQLQMELVRKDCLPQGAVEVRMAKARLEPEEEPEPGFEAVGSGPPGSERTCSLAAAWTAEGCKAKPREELAPVHPWGLQAGETGAKKRRGSQE